MATAGMIHTMIRSNLLATGVNIMYAAPRIHRMRKRKDFEDNLRRNRQVIGNWIGYAKFEESLQEFARYVL